MLPFPALEHVILLEVKFRVDSKAKYLLLEQRIVGHSNLIFRQFVDTPYDSSGPTKRNIHVVSS